MKRRLLCATLIGWAAAPRAGWAQPAPRRARIAVLGGSVGMADPATMRGMVEPLRKALRELGWVEGRNLDIEWRFAEGRPERLPALLAEALASAPDVLVAIGPRPAVLAKGATRTLPIGAAKRVGECRRGDRVNARRGFICASGAVAIGSWLPLRAQGPAKLARIAWLSPGQGASGGGRHPRADGVNQ